MIESKITSIATIEESTKHINVLGGSPMKVIQNLVDELDFHNASLEEKTFLMVSFVMSSANNRNDLISMGLTAIVNALMDDRTPGADIEDDASSVVEKIMSICSTRSEEITNVTKH